MIQLATEPTASRMSYRPAPSDAEKARASAAEVKHGRPGHPWPFLSRLGTEPARREPRDTATEESGS